MARSNGSTAVDEQGGVPGINARVPASIIDGIPEAARMSGLSERDLREVVKSRAQEAVNAEFGGATALDVALAHVEAQEQERQAEVARRVAAMRERAGAGAR